MSSAVEAMPSVYVSPSLERCFDEFAVDAQKIGGYMAKLGAQPQHIEDTRFQFKSLGLLRRGTSDGTCLGNEITMYPELMVRWGVGEARSLAKADALKDEPFEEVVRRLTSLDLDFTLKHELSHRMDELDPVRAMEVAAYVRKFSRETRSHIFAAGLGRALLYTAAAGGLYELAHQEVLPYPVSTAGMIIGSVATIGMIVKRGITIKNEAESSIEYLESPHEVRARAAEDVGPKGFFTIAIKPDYLARL